MLKTTSCIHFLNIFADLSGKCLRLTGEMLLTIGLEIVAAHLEAEYVKSFTCVPGVCLLNATSVLLSKNDVLGCKFPDVPTKQNFEPDRNPPNGVCEKVEAGCCEVLHSEDNITGNVEYETSNDLVDDDSLLHTLSVLQIDDNKGLMSENSQHCHIGCWKPLLSCK